MYLDDLPHFVFVGVATHGLPRQETINRAMILLRGALAHFGWTDGMYVVDRDGEGFEIGLVRGYSPTKEDAKIADRFFSSLRMLHRGERML